MRLELHWRSEDGIRLPMALWRPGPGYQMISSSILGGGLGPREWVLNAQVRRRLRPHRPGRAPHGSGRRPRPFRSRGRAADRCPGHRGRQREDEGVHVAATVGLRVPTWAAAPPGSADPELAPVRRPGDDQHHRLGAGPAQRRGVRQRRGHRDRGQDPGPARGGIRLHRDRVGRRLRGRPGRPCGRQSGRGFRRAAVALGRQDRPRRACRRLRWRPGTTPGPVQRRGRADGADDRVAGGVGAHRDPRGVDLGDPVLGEHGGGGPGRLDAAR